jgi:hypothetical protein
MAFRHSLAFLSPASPTSQLGRLEFRHFQDMFDDDKGLAVGQPIDW